MTETLEHQGEEMPDLEDGPVEDAARAACSTGHFAERHGLVIIVAVGESILAIGIGVGELPGQRPDLAASLGGSTST